ncbi:MAG: hypothetical protein HKN19_04985 [Halioglobus sp.]|nr:hypothetical protein [Halioglobus sp.]
MVSGLLTWICGLVMLMLMLASIPQGSAEQTAAAKAAPGPVLESTAAKREQ